MVSAFGWDLGSALVSALGWDLVSAFGWDLGSDLVSALGWDLVSDLGSDLVSVLGWDLVSDFDVDCFVPSVFAGGLDVEVVVGLVGWEGCAFGTSTFFGLKERALINSLCLNLLWFKAALCSFFSMLWMSLAVWRFSTNNL